MHGAYYCESDNEALEKNNILTDDQFEFRAHHSCELQLFVTMNDIKLKQWMKNYKLMQQY